MGPISPSSSSPSSPVVPPQAPPEGDYSRLDQFTYNFKLENLHSHGKKNVVFLLMKGELTIKDLEERTNDSGAKAILGLIYLQGYKDIKPDLKKAYEYLSESQHAIAKLYLGIIQMEGLFGVQKDVEKGVKTLEGDPDTKSFPGAKFCLAKYYFNTAKEKAEELQKQDPQNPEVQNAKAEVQKLAKQAFNLWIDLSSYPEYKTEAIKHLAIAYCRGFGVEEDFRHGENMLYQLYDSCGPVEESKQLLLTLQKERYQKKVTNTQILEKIKNDATSFFFWDKDKRSEERYWVGMTYLEGKLVKRDLEKAKLWLKNSGEVAAKVELEKIKDLEKQEPIVKGKKSFLKKTWEWIKMNKLQAIGATLGIAVGGAMAVAPVAVAIFALIIFPPVGISVIVISAIVIGICVLGALSGGSKSAVSVTAQASAMQVGVNTLLLSK